ncbi:MAG: hypothetical protein IPO67_31465 [Deltaproteobacteria bacterium]|nr:hypothetical protein [Deltaproteobacteria bacterium]MBK9366183.1 hypothetical protein [Deltaproteobacteria bacterium]MBK9649621.1 hypothetical protein [Deltaproteobacteria bacterium]
MPFWLLALACGGEVGPQAEVTSAASEAAAPSAAEEEDRARAEALDRRLSDLEQRLARVELLVAELHEGGIADAEDVRFDPSRTTLSARTVQEAVTELHVAVTSIKREASAGMGSPGGGLFEIPEGPNKGAQQGQPGQPPKPGQGPAGPPPGGKGGPAGPPPGGANASPQGQRR